MTVIEFLEARIEEDEKHWAQQNPATDRILAECAAKSDLITLLHSFRPGSEAYGACLLAVKRVAAIYSDHGDWRTDFA